MAATTALFVKLSFDPTALAKDFPAKWMCANKRVLASIAGTPATSSDRLLEFFRYAEMRIPKTYHADSASKTVTIVKPGSFDYVPVELDGQDEAVQWHLNFADTHLFGYYGGSLFAQDEYQVAEHPILASLRERLLRPDRTKVYNFSPLPFTRDGGQPTPCLIKNVERRVSVSVEPNAAEGRPMGIYGNRFAVASEDVVRKATKKLPDGTYSNIIAIEAPKGGRGTYTQRAIKDVLGTAYTGFAAAKQNSGEAPVVIHTGHWGTGAFGGNKVLMAALQIISARLAGVDALVFHAFDDEKSVHEALELVDKNLLEGEESVSVNQLMLRLEEKRFVWGQSDGN
eukprot:TRINITY_DN7417_c0_g1_i1.p1 TRINITY_DN7417_c0_g1~~TRINITY_DN7417_c0_g1_i1.p1  ORF type:complete len:341 (-),score=77.47 TRINITY_DN7417_c0_g1_i1:140-1162(-)